MQQKLVLVLALILSASLSGCSTRALKPMSAGDWSEIVHGLRGRLMVTEETAKFNGTRMGVVYLELQNLEDVLNPMEIYYDTAGTFQYDLMEESKHPIPQGLAEGSVMSPLPFWIILPNDSILRFRVSVNGYGIPKDAGLFVGLMPGVYDIPPTPHGDYFLSASFSVNPPAGSDIHAWRGVLKLPAAKIPVEK
ncbi:MAG TPA: hypothetical protein VK811_01395 [Candidatus Acidoferrum sp.]|nr:hypothetical protein [Candidatus Acidoferrum sp.]